MIGHRIRRARAGLPIDRDESLDAFCRRQQHRVRRQLDRMEERIAHAANWEVGDELYLTESRSANGQRRSA